MNVCVQVAIKGRVQGVGFRYYTRMEARRMGLLGWVKNQPDGSVAACICGTAEQVEAMKQWLKYGPSDAQVDQIEFSAGHLPDSCNDFRIV